MRELLNEPHEKDSAGGNQLTDDLLASWGSEHQEPGRIWSVRVIRPSEYDASTLLDQLYFLLLFAFRS